MLALPDSIDEIHIFSDGGSHIKNNLVVSAMFSILSRFGLGICVHWFVSYHGKSACDRHFGSITRQIKHYGEDVTTIRVLETCLNTLSNTTACILRTPFSELTVKPKTRVKGIKSLLSISSIGAEGYGISRVHPSDHGTRINLPALESLPQQDPDLIQSPPRKMRASV